MNVPVALLAATMAGPAPLPQDDSGPGWASPLRKGAVELSTAASFTSSSEGEEDDDDSISLLNVPLRLGVLVTRRLELEAEGQLSSISYEGDSITGYQLGGHALYHFGEGRVVPFLLVGAGIGDSADFFGVLVDDSDQTITSLRAGAGIKAFLGRHAAFRAEYRFVRYSLDAERFDFDSQAPRFETIHPTQHRVFTGISLFF